MEESIIDYIKDSIPKSKIREKIKWAEENTIIYCREDCVIIDDEYYEVDAIIKILEKLLEEK